MKFTSLIIIITGLGLIASLMFFPFNFRDQYTCLYHRLFSASTPVKDVSMSHHAGMSAADHIGAQHQHGSALIDRYVKNYAIFWWLGLFLTGGGIYFYRRRDLINMSKV